jgi:glucose-1-phosphate thymidylyltransferase
MVRLDQHDRVLEIVDKPRQTDLTRMWGCIVWRPRFTEFLHDAVERQGISDFAQIMNNAIKEGLCFRGAHITNGTYIDLGTYEEIMEMDQRFREE